MSKKKQRRPADFVKALAPQPEQVSLIAITPIIDGKVDHGYTHSLLSIQRACLQVGINFNWSFVIGNSMLPAARNRCVAKFMEESTATHILMLDADITVAWEDVMYAVAAGKEIVALPCIKRQIRWDRAVDLVRKRPEAPPEAIEAVLGRPNFVLDNAAASPNEQEAALGLMRATHAGTGCMIAQRSAFERFQKAYPGRWYLEQSDEKEVKTVEYFRYGRRDNFFIGEDYNFCDEFRAIGGEVWVKVDGHTRHSASLALKYDLAALHALEGEK
jgi:hypothetical protein